MIEKRDDMISLLDLEEGESGHILSVLGGRAMSKRLADLGLNQGAGITLLRKTLFSGPVQVEVCNSRFVLGRGLASKIMVKRG